MPLSNRRVAVHTPRAGWFTSLSLSLKLQLFFVPLVYKNHCAGEVSKILRLAHKRVGDIDENSIFGHGHGSTCSTQSPSKKHLNVSGTQKFKTAYFVVVTGAVPVPRSHTLQCL
jgi:hypothetical protein